MRIIAGTLRGRRIPFNNHRFGNARVTSDFVKEAIFGSLGPDLSGNRLLDPFAGSGQIGLEAVSRGATVWMNDRDRKRAAFIRSLVEEWEVRDQVTLTTEDWGKLFDRLEKSEGSGGFDIIYIDPPYDAVTSEDIHVSEACLRALAGGRLLHPEGRILVQHARRTLLPDSVGSLVVTRRRRYGDSLLSGYRHQ